jgi:hypothetical protein
MMYEMQLQWIRDLQNGLRSPWMDAFFKGWDFVDSFYFSLLVISLVLCLWDRRIGIRLFYILVMSYVSNQFLKVAFHHPDPVKSTL